MRKLQDEILVRVSHLDGDKQNAVLNFIKNMDGGKHSARRHRKSALRQIRKALEGMD